MPYRNIFIANQATMKLKKEQLIIYNGEEFSFPIEDVRSILIDNAYSSLTTKLLAKLADSGVCVIICNDKHMPCCQLAPIGSYCRMNKRIALQYNQSKPKLKRIWQQIVVAKIKNQAECLRINGFDEYEKLISISKSVQSGDASNREGYAASLYFKTLFGKDFTRNAENEINAALNYGYSIIRSFISKTLVCEGFEPSLGIHHKNQLNQFNLADDIIEPFRPIVDNYVFNNYKDWGKEFYSFQKAELLRLLNCKTVVNKKSCSLSHAIELTIQSIINSFEKDNVELSLPTVVETDYFDYD